jgi:hypothetical protein
MKKYEFASVAKGTLPVGDRWKLIKQLRNKDVYSRESAEATGGAANVFDLNALFDALPTDATAVVAVEDPVMAALAEQMAGTGMGTPGWGGQRKSRKGRKSRKSRKGRK